MLESDEHLGELVNGRWKVKRFLGEGENGSVYACSDTTGKESSKAIKFAKGKQARSSLQDEHRTLKRLNRFVPQLMVPTAFEYGTRYITHYFVMSRLGVSVEQWLRERRTPATNGTILRLWIKLVKMLRLMHTDNISHGDITLENILFGNDAKCREDRREVFLIDFGSSRECSRQSKREDLAEVCHVMIKMFRNREGGLIQERERVTISWGSLTRRQKQEVRENLEKAVSTRDALGTPIHPAVSTIVREVVINGRVDYTRIEMLLREALGEGRTLRTKDDQECEEGGSLRRMPASLNLLKS